MPGPRVASPPGTFGADIASAEGQTEEIRSLSSAIGVKISASNLAFVFENLPKKDAERNDRCGKCANETKNCV